jgi:hypothetical protein
MISIFIELTKRFDSDGELCQWLNGSIWSSICNRLIVTTELKGRSDRVVKSEGREFRFEQPSPLSGIISHLTSNHGGHVSDRGIVTVTASPCYHFFYSARNAVDMADSTAFASGNSPHQWLCYDFKTSRIDPTVYSLRFFHSGWGAGHCVRSWVIESSEDGATWTEIDRQNNNSQLKDGSVQSFQMSNDQACCFIQIRQTGPTESGHNYLVVCSWEIFGSLFEPDKQ